MEKGGREGVRGREGRRKGGQKQIFIFSADIPHLCPLPSGQPGGPEAAAGQCPLADAPPQPEHAALPHAPPAPGPAAPGQQDDLHQPGHLLLAHAYAAPSH